MSKSISDSEFAVRIQRAALDTAHYTDVLNDLAEACVLARLELLVYAQADDTPRLLCRSRVRPTGAGTDDDRLPTQPTREREIHLRAPLDDGCLTLLSAVVDGESAVMSRAARDRLAGLLPQFQHSLRVWLRLSKVHSACNDLRRSFDACRFGLILLDSHGRRLHANSEARRHLACGDILREQGAGIAAVSAQADRVLQDLLSRAQRGDSTGECVLYGRDSAAGSYLDVRLLPVASRPTEAGAGQASVAVYLLDAVPELPRADAHDFLRRRYALTPREADCALLIGAGASVAGVARAMNIAPYTARSHLRSIFNKTGIRRQPELVVLLARCASRLQAVVRAEAVPPATIVRPSSRAATPPPPRL